jgi:hypothetical protein
MLQAKKCVTGGVADAQPPATGFDSYGIEGKKAGFFVSCNQHGVAPVVLRPRCTIGPLRVMYCMYRFPIANLRMCVVAVAVRGFASWRDTSL